MKPFCMLIIAFTFVVLAIALPVRSHAAGDPPKVTEIYTPGMGEIMGGMQVRHAKLWFAGEAKNWPLATYELKEIVETFEDVQKMHPTFEENPLPTSQAIARYTSPPRIALEKSIAAKDEAGFQESFDTLTAACNTCHQEYKHDFIQITRPSKPPFTNQNFQPK